VRIRPVTDADEAVVRELYEEFEAEVPTPPSQEAETWDAMWADLSRSAREGVALLAEDDGGPVGYVFATAKRPPASAHLTDVYVRPRARKQGVARELVRRAVGELEGRGVEWVTLDVLVSNGAARAVWARLGFSEEELRLAARLETVKEHVAERPGGPSFGSVHVQSDDLVAIERAVRQFVPRLPGRSSETRLVGPRNGWTVVYDEVCDRDPGALRRLARELSDRMGAVVVAIGVETGTVVRFVIFEAGRIVDEYLSVPEFYGPLPPGEVVALAANPTVAARLTGADPGRVRAVARSAPTPDELPPALELVAAVGDALGLRGAEHGFADAEADRSVEHR
jgi:ribosomal protein S18 acetylase RimI-like enzyme